jgi:hypothetical protein
LVPVEAGDVVMPLKPVRCTRGQPLWLGEDPRPERHQVTEIPPVRPVITAYQWHRVVCPACGAATRAVVPVGIPTGGCSPRVRAGTLAHTSVASSRRPIRQEVERLLEAGQTCGVPKTEGTCREILNMRHAWWTFVRHEGVEPTKHTAERAIRPGVLWRTGRVGTQSPDGSRFVDTMMTVVATLKQQHRNVLDDVREACEAVLCRQPAPSLLPASAALEQLLYPAA